MGHGHSLKFLDKGSDLKAINWEDVDGDSASCFQVMKGRDGAE